MSRNLIGKWRRRQALRTYRTLTFRPTLEALEGRWLPQATLVTTASFKTGTGNVVGTAIPEDSAVLSGGYKESGTLTFTLTAPDKTVVDMETVTPNGDGTYTTSNAKAATQFGTYTWTVSFAGDALNNSAKDQGGSPEQ